MLEADNFSNDWYGYATNQAGHGYLIGFPAGYVAMSLGATVAGGAAVIFVVYLVLWEWLTQRSKNIADSLEDTAHVVLGALVVMSWQVWPFALQVMMIAVGTWIRMKRKR